VTVVVTGASSDVGRATSRVSAAEGATVGLFACGEEGLAAASIEVERAGGRLLVLPLVADASAVDGAATRAIADLATAFQCWPEARAAWRPQR